MTRIKHKIDKCLAEPTTIPTSLVERFNELCKKHFTVDEESSTKRTIRVKDAGELHIDDIGE